LRRVFEAVLVIDLFRVIYRQQSRTTGYQKWDFMRLSGRAKKPLGEGAPAYGGFDDTNMQVDEQPTVPPPDPTAVNFAAEANSVCLDAQN
jgi:hypothetical protein